jgi:hypothetical protein
MARMKPPKIPDNPVPVLTEEELRALLRTVDHDTATSDVVMRGSSLCSSTRAPV